MEPTTTSAVPYQPYRSKRHSRTVSNSNPSPEPQIPPTVSPAPSDDSRSQELNGKDVSLATTPNGMPPKPRPASISVVSQSPPITNGRTGSSTAPSSPTASSSKQTLTNAATPKRASTVTSPTSTFRRISPRTTSQPHAPSPLRPNYLPKQSSQSLTVSPSFSRQSTVRRFDAPQRPVLPQEPRSSSLSLPAPTAGSSARVSPIPVPAVNITPPPTKPVPSVSPVPTPAASPSPPPAPSSKPQSPSPTPFASTPQRRPAAPYRPGFQPKGVYRPRTDEFLAARSSVRDRDKVEQRRLERRLEKLISLHFPASTEKPPANRRASSIFNLDFSKNPTTLLREVVESRIQGSKADIRAEEQSITPWEDDAIVSQCPLCTASFHPLTNRKHHCRLCGRIICSLPPRPPTRTQTCSLLFVVDQRTGRIEEVGEGVDYGVKRRNSGKGRASEDDDKFLKGVRICRDCRSVLQRQQYMQEAGHVPTFARLYSTLVGLEKDIEDALPQFQELVLSLSTNTSTHNAPTADMRKRLLETFAEYDRLSKRIRQLPCPRGGSQDRVQAAIHTRANLFLQKNMFPLQSLPKPRAETAQKGTEKTPSVVDADSELAHALQPLLEQEALLETFVDEARAQRKFEDARTLKSNLGEIRAEIERIVQGGRNSPAGKVGNG